MKTLRWQREDRDVPAGTLCDVAGWGVVSHTGRQPDRLQYLTLPVLDRAICNLRRYHDGTVTERMMCAESSHRRDSCKVRGEAREGGADRGAGLQGGRTQRGGAKRGGGASVGGACGGGRGGLMPERETGIAVAELQVDAGGQGVLVGCSRPHDPVPRRVTPGARWCAGASPWV